MEWEGEKGPASEIQEAIRLDMANEIHRLLRLIHRRTQNGTNDLAVLDQGNFEATEVWNYFRKRDCPPSFSPAPVCSTRPRPKNSSGFEGIVDSGSERSSRPRRGSFGQDEQ